MQPKEFSRIRKKLGLTQKDMAYALRMKDPHGRQIRRYERAEKPISGPVSMLMESFDNDPELAHVEIRKRDRRERKSKG